MSSSRVPNFSPIGARIRVLWRILRSVRNEEVEEESNQKQPICKKRSAALEKAMVKKDVKSKVAAKKWL